MSFTPYSPVDSDSEKAEHDHFLESSSASSDNIEYVRRPWARGAAIIVPWSLTIILALLSGGLILERRVSKGGGHGSYEAGFVTDIIPSSKIPLEEVRFGRSPGFFLNGTGFLPLLDPGAPWPENLQLFGAPSPEIDANWRQYIGHRYFSISEEEATRAWGERRHEFVDQYKGGYTAGLDLFHTLHCLNAVRKALRPDYYPDHSSHGPFHLEHCLDAIRQHIQCYGSTTLIPTRFSEGIERNYIDTNQTHTCRSFTYLREFTTARGKKDGELYEPRDKGLLDERKHKIAAAWKARRKGKERGKGRKHEDHGNGDGH